MMSQVIPIFMSLIVFACFAGQSVQAQDDLPECEDSGIVWRNANRTCHPRAVCADVFDTVRNWHGWENRQNCREHRVIHQCMCPGEGSTTTTCPIDNPAHRLYASENQKQYTCQPACTLPYCGNLAGDQRSTTAVSMIQRDPTFGGRNYYRMECRCPRHHQPVDEPGVHRAVESYGSKYSIRTHNYITLYRCKNMGFHESNMQDPCLD